MGVQVGVVLKTNIPVGPGQAAKHDHLSLDPTQMRDTVFTDLACARNAYHVSRTVELALTKGFADLFHYQEKISESF